MCCYGRQTLPAAGSDRDSSAISAAKSRPLAERSVSCIGSVYGLFTHWRCNARLRPENGCGSRCRRQWSAPTHGRSSRGRAMTPLQVHAKEQGTNCRMFASSCKIVASAVLIVHQPTMLECRTVPQRFIHCTTSKAMAYAQPHREGERGAVSHSHMWTSSHGVQGVQELEASWQS